MAFWKRLLKQTLMRDGVVDRQEVALLRREFLADRRIDDEELDFLADLRNSQKHTLPEFDDFFAECVESNILADGVVDSRESAKLRKIIMADGRVDGLELHLLRRLKARARGTCPEFERLIVECQSA